MEGQSHQDVIADLITFTQRKTGGIQTLKNELWIILMVQSDIDDL